MASDSSPAPSTAAATAATATASTNAAIASAVMPFTTTNANGVPIVGALPHFVQLRQQRANTPASQLQIAPSSSSAPPQSLPQAQIQSLPPLRYPLASTGRGFVNSGSVPRPQAQTLAGSNPNPNPATYSVPSRSTMGYPPPPRPFGFVPSSPPVVKGFPISANPQHFKVGPSVCSLPDCVGGHKVSSDGVREDVCVLVRDRKVRISNGASIYSLCRSWLKNGHPEESQPQFPDVAKSFPLPKPAPLSDNYSPKRKKPDEEEDDDVDAKAAESMSTEELLQLHIKRAKRVRERLREERLQRIARYRSRLALLLPPLVEQSRNEPSDGG